MTMSSSRSAFPFCLATLKLLLLLASSLAHARLMPAEQFQQLLLAEEDVAIAAEAEPPTSSSSALCEEIYVVGEGETLHSISAKCDDPYIMEENPYINDDGDVYPGLVIKITAAQPTMMQPASRQEQSETGPQS